MAWYSSWIPSLPNFNFTIPASIQGRFLSFILKKSLGKFLKPGQLDHHQIDSQIGSGYVQVNDLELYPEAINEFLDGLPIVLHSGTISSVKARIPWPNPLASTLGFSLKSLHLTFRIVTVDTNANSQDPDISSSVASVAESFIHEELSPGEEANLIQSFHQEAIVHTSSVGDQELPGGLSSGQAGVAFESDPAGVSVFASLIERLLARFECDAQDIKLTLIHPDNMSLTLSVNELQYHTNDASKASSGLSEPPIGENRTLSIIGLSISCRNLHHSRMTVSPLSYSQAHYNQASDSPPLSRTSSLSSMDETTHFDMTRSILSLPPRAPSPVDSVSSSMYESAISMVPSVPDMRDTNQRVIAESLPPTLSVSAPQISQVISATTPTQHQDETILSFGTQPVIIRLTTPSPVTSSKDEDDPFLPSTESSHTLDDELRISISVGIISSIVRPWQIQCLSRLATPIAATPVRERVPDKQTGASKIPALKLDAQIRGVVLLLFSTTAEGSNEKDLITEFFNKPLIPPQLNFNYTRFYMDNLSVLLTFCNEVGAPWQKNRRGIMSSSKVLDVSLVDLSLFYIRADRESQGDGNGKEFALDMFPILITDPHLVSQYHRAHIHPLPSQTYPSLPVFNVIDWSDIKCKSFGTKLSQWRSPLPKHGPSSNLKANFGNSMSGVKGNEESALPSAHPAIKVSARVSQVLDKKSNIIESSDTLEAFVAPLNIRIDIRWLLEAGGLVSFVEDILPLEAQISDSDSLSSEETVDMYSSTRNIRARKGGLVEPRLGNTYEVPISRQAHVDEATVQRVINLSFVRLSVKCPPPRLESVDRSGTLIVDLHDISLHSTNQIAEAKVVKFAAEDADVPKDSLDETAVLKIHFNRAVVACSTVGSTVATAFISIGSLREEKPEHEQLDPSTYSQALKPCLRIMQPGSDPSYNAPSFALSIDVPAVHGDISKPLFDALQYWADDLGQLLECLTTPYQDSTNIPTGHSADTSLIGSRFFINSRSGSGSIDTPTESTGTVVHLTVTELFLRVFVLRSDSEKPENRPFDIQASDLDILMEVNPNSETVFTVGIMDMLVKNIDPRGNPEIFLSLTAPYPLSSTPKSILKLRFSTSIIPDINSKETRVKLTLCNFSYVFFPNLSWISDLTSFAKNPPGTFESVIPSERTLISVKIVDGSVQLLSPHNAGSIVFHINELDFSTDVIGDSRGPSFHVQASDLSLLAVDDTPAQQSQSSSNYRGRHLWLAAGYALLAEVTDLNTDIINCTSMQTHWEVDIPNIVLRLHLCADTLSAVTAFSEDFGSLFKDAEEAPRLSRKAPAIVNRKVVKEGNTLMSSVEDLAFKKIPEIGPAPDMIYDDLPTNLDYLDESFGAAAGLREINDEDLDDFDNDELVGDPITGDDSNVVSRVGGETIKIFEPQGLQITEEYFLTILPDKLQGPSYSSIPTFNLRVKEGDFTLFLYDGYDWDKTRKAIEEEVKEMRKRLAKIKQLVATGQVQDPVLEDTSTLLFNSVHIGLHEDEEALKDRDFLLKAIEEELKDDNDTASQSSWQSLRPSNTGKQSKVRSTRVHGKRLTRSKAARMEFCFKGLMAEFDQYEQDDPLVSRTFVTIRDLEILDHIKTSTWRKFLTSLRSDSRGNVRETDSKMVRIELRNVRPVSGHSSEEARLKAKILPLRLYVDQDAVDFLKKFFSFKDPHSKPNLDPSDDNEAYIQLAEIFPIDLKLDYKPRRVDYRALKEGRTIELMNFFHFDGAEMTLRHITLSGITGWGKMFEMLNDLWTPDVKATQLAEVISGVAPVRSVVNVGSGVADLILLPIAQYKKDGRIVRGVQKGATAFVKSTAIEAIKMGAKLATGTQVILEQAEGILGGQFETITAEPVQVTSGDDFDFEVDEEGENADLISKYAQQPADLKEGVQSAYKSLQRNLSSAAQTILAVPMEVYERSGNEGPVRSVIRAVPIAVLKPMIGASEAVSKTLLGLHNTLDPNVRHENDAKYKLR